MTQQITVNAVRTKFDQIAQHPQRTVTRFFVSSQGQTVVILGIDDYYESILKRPPALAKLQAAAKRRGLERTSLTKVNTILRGYRKDKRSGPPAGACAR